MAETGNQSPAQLSDLLLSAHRALSAGDLPLATTIGNRLIHDYPSSVAACVMMSKVYLVARRWQSGLQLAEKAAGLAPRDTRVLLHHGRCLITVGRRSEAMAIAGAVVQAGVVGASENDALGTLLTLCGQPAQARCYFERAIELAPTNCDYGYNCASSRRMNGDLQGAEELLDRVLKSRPDDVRAHYMRSDLRRQTVDSNHVGDMVNLMQSGLKSLDQEVMLGFSIAKELEDIADHDSSISYLLRANALQRRRMRYAVDDDIQIVDQLIAYHAGISTPEEEGLGADCLFVMGLPRSGTTLVDRFITNHTGVLSAGELSAFPEACIKSVSSMAGSVAKADFVQRLLNADATKIGQNYIDAARAEIGSPARFVDKLPTNYLYAAMIRRALPRARIIVLARAPMDVCYSMFKTLFTSAYPFSYDLTDLGRYYSAWHRLIQHWQRTLGEAVLTVQYEDLVQRTELVMRRVFAHCELPWAERVLRLDENQSPVSTASAAQVRRGIYSSSVGQWRHYARYLNPLREIIEGAGIDPEGRLAQPIEGESGLQPE